MATRGQVRRLQMQNTRLRRKIRSLKRRNSVLAAGVRKGLGFLDRYKYIMAAIEEAICADAEETEEEKEYLAEHEAELRSALEAAK